MFGQQVNTLLRLMFSCAFAIKIQATITRLVRRVPIYLCHLNLRGRLALLAGLVANSASSNKTNNSSSYSTPESTTSARYTSAGLSKSSDREDCSQDACKDQPGACVLNWSRLFWVQESEYSCNKSEEESNDNHSSVSLQLSGERRKCRSGEAKKVDGVKDGERCYRGDRQCHGKDRT